MLKVMQEIMLVLMQTQMQEVIQKQELIQMLKVIQDVNQMQDNLHNYEALNLSAFCLYK